MPKEVVTVGLKLYTSGWLLEAEENWGWGDCSVTMISFGNSENILELERW